MIPFSEIKQAFRGFHPRELMEYRVYLPFKFTAGVLQGIGVGYFAKAVGVNLQIIIGGRDITDLTDNTGILAGTGIIATLGAFLLYEAGESVMKNRSSIVVKRPLIFASAMKGGQRRPHKK